MKNIKVLISVLLVAIIFSCNENNPNELESELNEIVSLQSSVSAKQFIDSNEFIGVNVPNKSLSVESYSDYEIAKLKAAVYRFYKNVTIENDRYLLPLTSAKQLKISDPLYNMLYENLTNINTNLEKFEKEGVKIDIMKVDNEYLKSLLN